MIEEIAGNDELKDNVEVLRKFHLTVTEKFDFTVVLTGCLCQVVIINIVL